MSKEDQWPIRYEGFADLGRVLLQISSDGLIEVHYTHHPMVISQLQPWKKKVSLQPDGVQHLFKLLQNDSVQNLKCPELVLMPGQDVTLRSLCVTYAESILACTSMNTPEPLADILVELESLYDQVKAQR